jgi:hypothetical protein
MAILIIVAILYYLFARKSPITINQEGVSGERLFISFLIPLLFFGFIINWYENDLTLIYGVVATLITIPLLSLTKTSLIEKKQALASIVTVTNAAVLLFFLLLFIAAGSEYLLMKVPIF